MQPEMHTARNAHSPKRMQPEMHAPGHACKRTCEQADALERMYPDMSSCCTPAGRTKLTKCQQSVMMLAMIVVMIVIMVVVVIVMILSASAARKQLDDHIDRHTAGLLKFQRQGKYRALLQSVVQPHQHDVQAAWLKRNGLARRDVDILHMPHANDLTVLHVGVQFDSLCHR